MAGYAHSQSQQGFRQVNGGRSYADSRSFNYGNVSSAWQISSRPQFQQYRPQQFQQNIPTQCLQNGPTGFEHNRPPYFHQNQGFNWRPVYNSYNARMNVNTPPGSMINGSYSGHGQGAYVNQQRGQPNQLRSRNSKPLDFREWEYVKPEPPRHWGRFTILSYNILADYLANEHWRKLYVHIPRHMLSWEWRKKNLFFELRLWSPDIMCFQEVDRFQDLVVEFKRQGYDGIYKMRTGNPVDGCSIFWRTSKFKLLHEESIEFNKLDLRDNVAQICVLESIQQGLVENPPASDASSASSNRVVVCNIHVLFNPKRGDVKLGQVRVLFDKAHAVSKTWNNAPVVVCGDFNCTPKSALYNYILEQKLDVSNIARDKVSGQASTEIRAPMLQKPSTGFQAPVNVKPPMTHTGLNSDVEKSDSHLDTQKHIIKSGTVDVIQGQSQHVNPDEVNGTRTSQGELSSGDVDDVFNGMKSILPISCSTSVTSLMSNKIATDIRNENGESLGEIPPSESSSDGTIHTENKFPRRAEITGHVTDTALPIYNSTSDASPFANIFEESTKLLRENEDIGEDAETFLSELTSDSLNSDYNQLGITDPVEEKQIHNLAPESEPDSPKRTSYNSSIWTPSEIETATGNRECTSLEHPLHLRSTYSETEDLLGTRDANGEPLITSYHRCFCGTVDYIWRSEGLQTVKVLSPMRREAMQWTAGFPTKKWGSDHIALVAQLAFVQGTHEDH